MFVASKAKVVTAVFLVLGSFGGSLCSDVCVGCSVAPRSRPSAGLFTGRGGGDDIASNNQTEV